MPLFEFIDQFGNKNTVSGDNAVDQAGEIICQEVLGKSLVDVTRAFLSVAFTYNGQECVFLPSLRVIQVKAAETKADLMSLTSGMRDLAEEHGFIDCPECKGVHDRKVINCRRCGHRAEIPEEARQDLMQSLEAPEEPDPVQEAQSELDTMDEYVPPKEDSALAFIGSREEEIDENQK